jgi:hypothetical protein
LAGLEQRVRALGGRREPDEVAGRWWESRLAHDEDEEDGPLAGLWTLEVPWPRLEAALRELGVAAASPGGRAMRATWLRPDAVRVDIRIPIVGRSRRAAIAEHERLARELEDTAHRLELRLLGSPQSAAAGEGGSAKLAP